MGVDDDQETDTSSIIAAARSPTRCRLLALLAGITAAHSATAGAAVTKQTAGSDPSPELDSVSALFIAFEALLVQHETLLWRCDRLEAWLQAELDYPRVRLPSRRAVPERYAVDPNTIAHLVPPGRRRYRLQQILLRRQVAWDRGVKACGLARAKDQEAALDAAVRAAAAALVATPATTLREVQQKLLTLLAVQEPGNAFRHSSPWAELRSILADVSRLADVSADATT